MLLRVLTIATSFVRRFLRSRFSIARFEHLEFANEATIDRSTNFRKRVKSVTFNRNLFFSPRVIFHVTFSFRVILKVTFSRFDHSVHIFTRQKVARFERLKFCNAPRCNAPRVAPPNATTIESRSSNAKGCSVVYESTIFHRRFPSSCFRIVSFTDIVDQRC